MPKRSPPPSPRPDAGGGEATPVSEHPNDRFPVVCIAAAAGGPEALAELLPELRPDLRLSIVLIQRHPPSGEELAAMLAAASRLPVVAITEQVRMQPGHLYIAPAELEVTISGGVLRLARSDVRRTAAMPADVFLRSLAHDRKEDALGVVLSGGGSDGALGLKEIKAQGGVTFVQDPSTIEHASMPRSAISMGAADFVLPPAAIAQQIARVAAARAAGEAPAAQHATADDQGLAEIFSLLRAGTGVDFSQYKRATMRRRLRRRMVLHQLEHLPDYARHLRDHADEVRDLFQDLLIRVTAFFRDPDTFATLKTLVFPAMLHDKPIDEPVRIWVPGCATGEEVYSIAIALIEYLGEGTSHAIRIFGTDLSDAALQIARAGRFLESIGLDVSPERLRRFFVDTDGGFQVSELIRNLCLFARQNVAADPPFSKLDLISCRNLLIYLEPSLQRRILHTFHFALKPGGFLTLGSSETIGQVSGLFEITDKAHKIFVRKAGVEGPSLRRGGAELTAGRVDNGPLDKPAEDVGRDLERAADRIVLSNHAPPGVIVDETLQILQFRGRTAAYLEPAPGDPSLSLLKMAREGLVITLSSAMDEARSSDRPVRKQARVDGAPIVLEVWPLATSLTFGRCFLVLFRESAPRPPPGEVEPVQPSEISHVEQLEQELQATLKYLHAIIEEQEATNEELKSANEEILSSNEELHSLNEELESAKEELQSVNEELERRNADLGKANHDLSNLLSNLNLPILMLDADLRIRRFTPAVERLLEVTAGDIGTPVSEIRSKLTLGSLAELAGEVIGALGQCDREVEDHSGRVYWMRVRPYRSPENKLDGVMITWIDIDAVRRGERELRESRDRLLAIVEAFDRPLLVLDGELRVRFANRAYYETFRAYPGETEDKLLSDLGDGAWDLPGLGALLREEVLREGRRLSGREVEIDLPHIGRRTYSLGASRLRRERGAPPALLLSFEDVTQRRPKKRRQPRQ